VNEATWKAQTQVEDNIPNCKRCQGVGRTAVPVNSWETVTNRGAPCEKEFLNQPDNHQEGTAPCSKTNVTYESSY